MEVINIQFV